MPAAITLSRLSYSTPDGTTLFSELDLAFGPQRTGLVGRNGVGKSTLLRLIVGELQPQSGTVTVSGTMRMLRQTVGVPAETAISDALGITDALAALSRIEAGTGSAEDFETADWTIESRIAGALDEVGLPRLDMDRQIGTLSGGQRTRLWLAGALIEAPDFILLDEPTNNLDAQGRTIVRNLLANRRGGAIVVSHDRELLEMMDVIVEMTSLGATSYGGNFSFYRERKVLELAAARHDLVSAERRLAEVDRNTQATREKQARRDRAGRQQKARDDIPRIILGREKDYAEKHAGDSARLAERRRDQARCEIQTAREKIEILQPVTVSVPPTHLPAARKVFTVDAVTAGYASRRPLLSGLSLALAGPQRVAITGSNGSGKTTLVKLLTGELEPLAGTVAVHVPFVVLDQQVSVLNPALTIRDNFLALNPGSDENACRAALARFKFRAGAALQVVETLSGGETLRAGLACVLGTAPPQLLILDEPTNHLDLDAIAAVEGGLRAYDGALLVVSHDREFLKAIGIERVFVLPTKD